jgi:hypothetical protein
MWQIKLSRWKEIPGIFLYLVLAATPAAQNTPYARLLKTMMKTTASHISLEHWDVVDLTMMRYVEMQRWLRRADGREREVVQKREVESSVDLVEMYLQ